MLFSVVFLHQRATQFTVLSPHIRPVPCHKRSAIYHHWAASSSRRVHIGPDIIDFLFESLIHPNVYFLPILFRRRFESLGTALLSCIVLRRTAIFGYGDNNVCKPDEYVHIARKHHNLFFMRWLINQRTDDYFLVLLECSERLFPARLPSRPPRQQSRIKLKWTSRSPLVSSAHYFLMMILFLCFLMDAATLECESLGY